MQIVRLADRSDLLPALARGYEAEWPDWYGPEGPGNVTADLSERLQTDGLPIGLVAVEDNAPVGAVALAERSIASHAHLSPWLIGLWVEPRYRGRGFGGRLVRAAVDTARELGVARLHAATATAASLFERGGWTLIDTAQDERHAASVFAIAPQGLSPG